jgi:hypothetical protein
VLTIHFTALAVASPANVTLTVTDLLNTAVANIGAQVRPYAGAGSAVTVTVLTPNAQLLPAALTFNTTLGVTTGAQAATLTNTGDANLTVNAIAIAPVAGTGTFNLAGGTCVAGVTSLAPAASCTVNVTFTGAAALGATTANLNVTTNDPDAGGVVTTALTGNTIAQPPGQLLLNGVANLTVNFGAVLLNTTVPQNVVVSNGAAAGSATLPALAVTNPAAPFSIVTDGCTGQALAPGASCTIVIGFTPIAEVASNSAFNVVAGGTTIPVALTGVGTLAVIPTLSEWALLLLAGLVLLTGFAALRHKVSF